MNDRAAADVAAGGAPTVGTPVVVMTASGRVGSRLCRLLDADGIAWRGLTRDPAGARRRAAQAGFVPRAGDWVSADLERPTTVASTIVPGATLFLASPDHPYQDEIEGALVDAARKAGCGHLVKLSAQSAGLAEPVSFGRFHARSEAAVRSSGLPWTVLRPVFFMQSLLFFADPAKRGVLPAPTGRGRVAFVDADDVADAAHAVVAERAAHAGRVHTLTGGDSHTFADVAAHLTERLGRRTRHVSPPAWLARIALPIATGMPRWQAALVVELLRAIAGGAQSQALPELRAVTGRAPRRLQDFLDAHLEAFR